MRRTYRSKKETTGAIDPRDVLLTMDAKSSVFDAFYIQNIKQNKRDMSVGSAMHFGASNKVRKRKYVKRLKEQDVTNKPRESNSNTAFLTPDKSFRVKKAPDLFDQLLNSSNNTSEPINTFNKPSMQTRTYVKTQPNRKKINYSNNDSTDSDKENSSTVADETANSSDIRSHKLLIEKEIKSSQKCTDKSINDIANNLSIFSSLKNQTATPRNKNCLLHQPLQTSPLCSTPFLEKYRGASIYRFSPISINLDDSPKNVIINSNEDKTNINNTDENKNTYKGDNQYPEATDIKENKESHSISDDISNNFQSDITNISINKTQFKSTNSTIIIESPILPNKTVTKRNPIKSSCLQTTEMESFHGFGNSDLLDNNHLDAICDKYKEFENILGVDSHDVDGQSLDSIHIDNIDSTVENTKSNSTNSNISYFESESESCYDTCNSDDFDDMEQNWEPVVLVERLNDSVFNKYYDLMPKCTENEDLDSTNFSDNNDYDLMPKCTENEDLDSTNFSDNNDYASSTVSESVSDSCSTNADISNFSVTDDNSLNDDNESIYSNEIDSDNPKSPEDVCLNFVTTRRRVIPNDSILLDNTITSSNSSDVDKTVLNKKSLEDNFLVNNLGTLNKEEINLEEVGVKSKSFDNKETNQIEATLEIQRRITRKSARLSLKTKSQLPVNIPTVENNSHNVQTRKSSRISTSVANYEQEKHSEINNIASKAIESANNSISNEKPGIVLQPGKRWERSLSIYRRMTTMADHFDETILDEELLQNKGRKYRQSVIMTMEMQGQGSLHNDSIKSRRSTFFSKPSRSTIKTIRESNPSRDSLCSTICEDLQGFLGEDCDDTIIELSKLSIADSEHEVTLIEKFHDTSNRIATARDYVLRRCNQTDVLLFDECYPDPLLKNCRKIGEGVYGEVFLWRAGDGRARVLKVIPIAGSIKVNGEQQKDFHEIISEIVIAMELSALRAPIADIEKHLNEGKSLETLDLHSVENATDVFNEVLSVRCVRGSYPSRLLDLWDLYDESRGSENDNPALLPTHQQYIVLELANAGQDLESYQFVNAEQSYALFKQIAFGLAVAEEACQFEHRDLHWGNVLISPTDQKTSHFVVRGRAYSLACCGVRASIIDYSLSRATVGRGALYSDLAHDEALFDALGDYQFTVYRLMRDKLGNDWKNFEPYTNILWLHYTVDKMITALRYTRTNSKIHKHYIAKLKEVKNRILDYGSAVQFVLTDNEL